MNQPSATPDSSRSAPSSADDLARRRRAVGPDPHQTSSLPEAQITGEPGEEVLGGADGVPLTPDETVKDEALKKR